MSLHDWTKISPCAPNSTAITAEIVLSRPYILPVRNIWTARFLRVFFVFYDIKSKRISNRHISCDVYIRSECASCPADVATAARPRTATHDHGRFYSFINKISCHGSRRFIFTGSCSVYIIMRQLSRAKPGNPASTPNRSSFFLNSRESTRASTPLINTYYVGETGACCNKC